MQIRAVLAAAGLAAVLLPLPFAAAQKGAEPALQAPASKTVRSTKPLPGQPASVIKPARPATPAPQPRGVAPAFWLHVLHSNDGESKILPIATGAPAGFAGVSRFKTRVDSLRDFAATYPVGPTPRGVVLISSGDNILPGPQLNASLNQPLGSPFYDAIAYSAINFSAMTLGNHDFDGGPATLARFISGFTAPTPFISSNLAFAAEPALQALVTQNRIAKSVVVDVAGRQVGIIGATTTDLPFISSPGNVLIEQVLPAVQAEADRLNALGVNIIILSSHLQGLSSEFNLIPSLRHVDLVIGGGGSELLANPTDLLVPGDVRNTTNLGGTGYPRFNSDSTGRAVPLVTTAGDFKYVGRLVVGFDAAGNLQVVDSISGPVRVAPISRMVTVGGIPTTESFPDGVAPDPFLESAVVAPVQAAVAALGVNVVAVTEVPLDGRTNSVRSVETNFGNLTADSFLYTATALASQFNTPVPEIAFTNAGGIRNNLNPGPGNYTELNTLDMLAFANFLVIIPDVPAQRIKDTLENAVARVAGTGDPQAGSGNGRFAQIAGFRFSWDASRTPRRFDAQGNVTEPGQRVRDVVLNDGRVLVRNGQVVPGAPALDVATIDFLANGGDQYPLTGLPFTRLGVTYQGALVRYLQSFLGGQISAFAYPVGGQGRIRRMN